MKCIHVSKLYYHYTPEGRILCYAESRSASQPGLVVVRQIRDGKAEIVEVPETEIRRINAAKHKEWVLSNLLELAKEETSCINFLRANNMTDMVFMYLISDIRQVVPDLKQFPYILLLQCSPYPLFHSRVEKAYRQVLAYIADDTLAKPTREEVRELQRWVYCNSTWLHGEKNALALDTQMRERLDALYSKH